MKLTQKLASWGRRLKEDIRAIYLAYRDPRTPLTAKALTFFIVAYAFSPLDLIPDIIPIFGLIDDLILLPLLIALAIKMIPAQVMSEARMRAKEHVDTPVGMKLIGASIVLLLWALLAFWAWRLVSHA